MANTGKFIDRNPAIIAAGVTSGQPNKIKDCFIQSPLDYKFADLKSISCKLKDFNKSGSKILNEDRYNGFDTKVRRILQPDLKSSFEHLMDKLKDTSYASHWNSPLGKPRDQIPGLPAGLDPKKETFGVKTKSEMTAGELVNPPKLPGQVLFESRLGHELYVKSHEDYHPGEHINRKYLPPNFNPDHVFGFCAPTDRSGKLTRRNLIWINPDNLCTVRSRQARFFEKSRSQLGKTFEPNNILGTCVPEDHTFGVGTSSIYGVAELLRTCKSSSEKKDLMFCLEHINKLRQLLKNKNPPFEFDAFLKALQYFDQENIRWIPIDVVQKTCQFFELSLHKEKLETIMKQIGIMRCDGCVEYKKFCELLNWRYEFPDIGKIVDIPPEKQYYNTTYNVFARNQQCDGSDNLDVHPSNTCNCVLYPIKENEAVNVSEADIKTLISPSIFSQYGVTPEDFFKPRDKETIYNIFTHIGVKLPDDLFESIWNEAYQCDESGGVCVETFRNILDKLVAEHAKTE